MSEEKPKRSLDEIQQEFGQLCAKAGHNQYQIYVLQKDLDMINDSIRDLNLEAAAVKAAEPAPAAEPTLSVVSSEGGSNESSS